ncbi:hypothetical protein Tco_0412308 [Tanacetum coccineum]
MMVKGGAIVLNLWIEKMENVIDNSGCAENQKVKYAASSLVNKALTWWNTQVQQRRHGVCKGNFWIHKMVGANHAAYTDRFHELAKLVPHLVTPESSRIKRAGILTDEVVSCGTLTKGSDKRNGVEESEESDWKESNKLDRITVTANLELEIIEIPVEDGRILRVHGERTVGIAKVLKSVKKDEPKLGNIPIVREFEDVFPRRLVGITSATTSGVPHRSSSWCDAYSKVSISFIAFRDAILVWATTGVARQGFAYT